VNLLEVGKSVKEKYFEQAKSCELNFLLQGLEICRQCDMQYKGSNNQRLLVELSLMQLASITASDRQVAEKKKPSIIPAEAVPPKKAEAHTQSKSETESQPTAPPTPKEDTDKQSVEKAPQKLEERPQKEEATPPEEKPQEPNNQESSKEEETPPPPPEEPTPTQVEEPISNNSSSLSRKEKLEKLKAKKAKTSTLSIQQLTQEEKQKQEAASQESFTSDLREEFTLDQLKEVWAALSQKVKNSNKEGSTIIYSAMIGRDIELKENFNIHLMVDNKSQAEEIAIKKTDIHDHLRKKLRNGAIELSVEIIKNPKLRKAYTAEEKFNELAEQNPALKELKKALDLEFL
jgi:DNA polymerase-3 subunit gamma/tau